MTILITCYRVAARVASAVPRPRIRHFRPRIRHALPAVAKAVAPAAAVIVCLAVPGPLGWNSATPPLTREVPAAAAASSTPPFYSFDARDVFAAPLSGTGLAGPSILGLYAPDMFAVTSGSASPADRAAIPTGTATPPAAVPVPEPSAAWLLGAVLFCWIMVRKNREAAK